MVTQVKICGVRDGAGARACLDEGVDLIGFNFVPTSRRCVSAIEAAHWAQLVGADRSVGVFCDQLVEQVRETARRAGVHWIQLHGGEPPAVCLALRHAGFRIIKALALTDGLTADLLEAYAGACDLLLFDGAQPGSGKPWDHERLIALAPSGPFFLAGGLTPNNVAETVRRVRPHGVDTASGVEEQGTMSAAKIAAFCRAARQVSQS